MRWIIVLILTSSLTYANTFNSLSGYTSSVNHQSYISIYSGFNAQPSKLILFNTKTSHLTPDADGDTIPDIYEIDNDNDGLTDQDELFTHMTLHNNPDSDGDELLDGAEVNTTKTLPHIPDTDMDEMPDGWEVVHLLNPLVDDASIDADGDGFSNIKEFINGTNPNIYSLTLEAGWNLVSLARIPDDSSVTNIFKDDITGSAWYWDNNQFQKATNIDPLKGYWVYSKSLQDILFVKNDDDITTLINAVTGLESFFFREILP